MDMTKTVRGFRIQPIHPPKANGLEPCNPSSPYPLFSQTGEDPRRVRSGGSTIV